MSWHRHDRAAEYQRLKEEMLGLEHDPDLAPIDDLRAGAAQMAPKAIGEVQF